MFMSDFPLAIKPLEDACSPPRPLQGLSVYFSLPTEEIDTDSTLFLIDEPLYLLYGILFILDEGPRFLKRPLDRLDTLK